MFYALAAGKIDTAGFQYVHELQDIETLNQRALRGELEITAVSVHAYAYIADRYALLTHGASMGMRYGPRLVARQPMALPNTKGKRIAIPGPLTTAYLALQLAQPDFVAVPMPFDAIEEAVAKGDVELGLLIHEGQLTFQESGLHLILDLGEWWYAETGLPLPLGGNVVRKDMGEDTIRTVSRHLHASIAPGERRQKQRQPAFSTRLGKTTDQPPQGQHKAECQPKTRQMVRQWEAKECQ
jgi:1,4-dihydroxy-6-naphthoate synthase